VFLVLVCLVTILTKHLRHYIQAEICNFIPVIFYNLPLMMNTMMTTGKIKPELIV